LVRLSDFVDVVRPGQLILPSIPGGSQQTSRNVGAAGQPTRKSTPGGGAR